MTKPSPWPLLNLPFTSVLIANRGEIAIRLIDAVRALGLRPLAIYTEDDATSPHIRHADRAHNLGSSHTLYNHIPAVLSAAKALSAGAIHPGYGFLSENPDAVHAFSEAAIVWLGPDARTMNLFSLKHTARKVAIDANVPVLPGTEPLPDLASARSFMHRLGLPVLLKATAGGGGMGQAIVTRPAQLDKAFTAVVSQARQLFSNPDVYLEHYVQDARHIEVQIFGDGLGNVLALGDRDCSVQRRRQKVVEEAPAPALPHAVRTAIREAAVNLCAKVAYKSAGTVEFVMNAVGHNWYFLEVNTRLQVEHGVTELVAGVDIAQAMVLIEAPGGEKAVMDALRQAVERKERGACIEVRLYAENPVKEYLPCPGVISHIQWPNEVVDDQKQIRVDHWAERGTIIAPHYDPLLGKVLAWAPTRPLAIVALRQALAKTVVRGVATNVELLRQVIDHPSFMSGHYDTGLLTTFDPAVRALEVVKPGVQSSLQDYPGRVGYWNVGVSPSGPMDAYAMGMANALVGNDLGACALEITVAGPTLLFHVEAVVAITGAHFDAIIDDGLSVDLWTPVRVPAGSTLSIGKVRGTSGGKIGYLAVRGGFDAPKYLGSASTFPNGKFGGLTGSFLAAGDFLPIGVPSLAELEAHERNGLAFRWPVGRPIDERLMPIYESGEWVIAALCGPHASSEFFERETLSEFWQTPYEVHHATNRLGARLIGPVPKWTRADGGSAGLHPSNLHDYTYAPGAVNFSGNTPIVLMLDGPSLGGFVCPLTVATVDFWKIAQALPGEYIRFKQVDFDQASKAMVAMEAAWSAVRDFNLKALDEVTAQWSPWWVEDCSGAEKPAVLASLDPEKGDQADIKVVYRMSGDEHILVEYGEIELDLAYRLRVHAVMEELQTKAYVKELCPGVRSLLIRYDRKLMHIDSLVKTLTNLESGLMGSLGNMKVPSRVIELPLAFEDKWTIEAQARYLRSVRSDAPYMPSNVEFVRRINGLESVADVERIMTSAEYMVLGLGDVYLGAPCAVPVDPRHRLVTSKYNPARTFTPEGAVGIGGAYMCIYGMNSPGGYQLTGRTLPIWDNYGSIPEQCRGAGRDKPWLLEFFDRVKFFPVSDDELKLLRARFRNGDYKVKISQDMFSYSSYEEMINSNKESIEAFERMRKEAYMAERARWEAEGEAGNNSAATHTIKSREAGSSTNDLGSLNGNSLTSGLPEHAIQVKSHMSASVWSIAVKEGDTVEKGDELILLESMKVEISVEAPVSGVVHLLSVEKGDAVRADDTLCVIIGGEDLGGSTILDLRELYSLGAATERQVVEKSLETARSLKGLFKMVRSAADTSVAVEEIERAKERREHLPLVGIPYTISEGVTAEKSRIVNVLTKAGAICIGQTTFSGPGKDQDDGTIVDGHSSAVTAIKEGASVFAIVVDVHGSSTAAPMLSGGCVMGFKTTEGLLPVVDGVDDWSESDSVAIFAQTAADLRTVFNVCLRARTRDNRILRPMSDPDRLQGHELGSCYHRWTIGMCPEDVLQRALLQERHPEEAKEAYLQIVHQIEQHGYKTREVDVGGLERVLKVLKKGDGLEGLSLQDSRTLQLCKREVDVAIWRVVDAVVLPVFGVGEGNGSFSDLVALLDTCSLSVADTFSESGSKGKHGFITVARAMNEEVVLELARVISPTHTQPP